MVLAHGKMAYFGPAQVAVDFFADKGFPCPPHFNPADYIIDIVRVTPLLSTVVLFYRILTQ